MPISEFVTNDKRLGASLSTLPTLTRSGVVYGFSKRAFGNMDYRFSPSAEVLGNRQRFADAVGVLTANMVVMDPVHSDGIAIVGRDHKGAGFFDRESAIQKTDALVTTEKGVALVLNPADCVPVIVTNRSSDFLALIHAGRDGTNLEISRKVIQYLKNMGFDRMKDYMIGIGPSIECYAQKYIKTENPDLWLPNVWLPFDSKDEVDVSEIEDLGRKRFIIKSSSPQGEIFVDLTGANIRQLVTAGVPSENISALYFCTHCNAQEKRIFSHITTAGFSNSDLVSEYPEGRFMVVAQLRTD